MARKAEATLWVKLKIGRRSVMKRMLRKGRGYAQKSDGPTKPVPTISATPTTVSEYGKARAALNHDLRLPGTWSGRSTRSATMGLHDAGTTRQNEEMRNGPQN